jgi:hypothetical protein
MVLTDVEIVAILAVVLIITYFIGSYWKHKTLSRYAHWFEDKFSNRAKVGYKSYGHAGLRIKCEMKSESDGYSKLEFALSLGARENLIYYPYALVTRDYDHMSCWASLSKAPRFRVLVIKTGRKVPPEWDRTGSDQTSVPELEGLGYSVYSTGTGYAVEFLRRLNLRSRIETLKLVQALMLQYEPSRLQLTATLQRDKLSSLIDFIGFAARAV